MRPPPARTPRGRTGRPSARFPPTARDAGTGPRERELRGPGRARRLPERLPGQGSRLGTPRRAVNGRGAPRRALPEKGPGFTPEKRPAPARKNAPGSPSENRKKTGRPGRREPAPGSGNSGAPDEPPGPSFSGNPGFGRKSPMPDRPGRSVGDLSTSRKTPGARGPVPCRKDGRGRGGAGDSREARGPVTPGYPRLREAGCAAPGRPPGTSRGTVLFYLQMQKNVK